MWTISAQDEEALLGITSVWIERVSRIGVDSATVKEHRLQAETAHATGWLLGTFPTKERAMEELKRIRDWIALQNGQGVYQVSQEDK